jgi:hypothetical protein
MDRVKRGFLVLADISGFTEFVTATEIEHGPPIIAALLDEMIGRIAPPLSVSEIEGDAVFALGPQGSVVPPESLLDILRAAFEGFLEKRRELASDDSCSCNVCSNVLRLRLKIIGHHGAFIEQSVGERTQAAGRDVILAHRLLKNRLEPTANYALLTRAALETMGVDPAHSGLTPHRETYEHLGEIECFVHALDDNSATTGATTPALRYPQAEHARTSATGIS